PHLIPHDPAVVEAARRGLVHLASTQPDHPAAPVLADVVASATPDVRGEVIRKLLAALTPPTPHRPAVVRALLRLGCTDPALVPHLWDMVATWSDRRGVVGAVENVVEAARALWRVARDATALINLLRRLLTETKHPWIVPAHHSAVTEAAGALAPLVPAAATHLTGEAAFTAPDRDRQVLAARLTWAVTGDAAAILPTLRAVLARRDTPAHEAARLVADLADAGVDLADIESLLRPLLQPGKIVDGVSDENGYARAAAARALWRLGVPPAELTATLVDAIQDRSRPGFGRPPPRCGASPVSTRRRRARSSSVRSAAGCG
ncbi:MAG: hypothetical protein IRY85_15465, partial [Micromonosporaceae bacterium]|nr:hypothetical protein [Micromonosporaceae bacterium]